MLLEVFVVLSSWYWFQMEVLDPDLDMPIGKPPPPRQPVPDVSLAEALAQLKPALMQSLGLKEGDEADEQLWAQATEGAPELVEQALQDWKVPRGRDTWVRAGLSEGSPLHDAGQRIWKGRACLLIGC